MLSSEMRYGTVTVFKLEPREKSTQNMKSQPLLKRNRGERNPLQRPASLFRGTRENPNLSTSVKTISRPPGFILRICLYTDQI